MKLYIIVFTSSLFADIVPESKGQILDYDTFSRCVPIPKNLTICGDVSYKSMALPNLFKHETETEVIQQSSYLEKYAGFLINCDPNAKTFLCSLLAPICINSPGGTVQLKPCHNLCQNVKISCINRLRNSRISKFQAFDDYFDCSKFPEHNEMCVPPRYDRFGQTDPSPTEPTKTEIATTTRQSEMGSHKQCPICKFKVREGLKNLYCRNSKYVAKVRLKSRPKLIRSNGIKEVIQIKGAAKFLKGNGQNRII